MKNSKSGHGRSPSRSHFLILAAFVLTAVLTVSGCSFIKDPASSGRGSIDSMTLDLPDEYYIEATVTASGIGSQTTTYAVSKSDGWVYIKLGYDREQYVYKPLSGGKFIEYKYSAEKKTFVPTMISDALQEQIEAGNVPLDSVATGKESVESWLRTVEPYLCGYRMLRSALSYCGTEEFNGIECEKYTGSINTVLTVTDLEFLIDPDTGLAMRYVNRTKTGLLTTEQTVEITEFSTEPRIPSVS